MDEPVLQQGLGRRLQRTQPGQRVHQVALEDVGRAGGARGVGASELVELAADDLDIGALDGGPVGPPLSRDLHLPDEGQELAPLPALGHVPGFGGLDHRGQRLVDGQALEAKCVPEQVGVILEQVGPAPQVVLAQGQHDVEVPGAARPELGQARHERLQHVGVVVHQELLELVQEEQQRTVGDAEGQLDCALQVVGGQGPQAQLISNGADDLAHWALDRDPLRRPAVRRHAACIEFLAQARADRGLKQRRLARPRRPEDGHDPV